MWLCGRGRILVLLHYFEHYFMAISSVTLCRQIKALSRMKVIIHGPVYTIICTLACKTGSAAILKFWSRACLYGSEVFTAHEAEDDILCTSARYLYATLRDALLLLCWTVIYGAIFNLVRMESECKQVIMV